MLKEKIDFAPKVWASSVTSLAVAIITLNTLKSYSNKILIK